MMDLNDFPAAIAHSHRQLLEKQQEVRSIQAEMDYLSGQIDHAIAFDADLKNDLQRKAKRFELMSSGGCLQLQQHLQQIQDTLTELEIDHQCLLNQFAVAKLRERRAIANLELQSVSQKGLEDI